MSDSVVMRLGVSGGIVAMVEENLITQRSSHSSKVWSLNGQKIISSELVCTVKKTLLDRERDREIMKVNLITLIILKATLVSSCWWKKSEQVVKRRAYPVTKSRNSPPRPSLPKPTKGMVMVC